MNKVILMGRLTKDTEIRYTSSAEPLAVGRYTLAVNKSRRREGEPDADFINCVVFGKSAEFAERYFKKGQRVAVEGRLSIRSWDNDAGQRQWMTEVLVDEQHFADSANSGGGGNFADHYATQAPSRPASPAQQAQSEDSFFEIDSSLDDDLPF